MVHKNFMKWIANKAILLYLFFITYTLLSFFAAVAPTNAQEQQKTKQSNETLLFQTTATLSTTARHTKQGLYKGLSVSFPVEENTRYAALVTSQSLDSVVQLNVENNNIFRDIFLGEDAGIVFTPRAQSADAGTQLLKTTATSMVNIAALFHAPKKQKNDHREHDSRELGTYTLSVYKIASHNTLSSLPFVETSAELTNSDAIVGRVSQEYAVYLTKNTRLYAFMTSRVFDTLLEFSNTYGEVVASDDWVKDATRSTSLLSILVPQDGTYFITSTSFSGIAQGNFSLNVFTTKNEPIFSQNATLNTKDIKIFKRYIREYPLTLKETEAATISVSALSGNVEVIFARDDRSALYTQKVDSNKTKNVPVFAEEAGSYKVIIASDSTLPINYSIEIYK